jgi:ribosomal protein L19E
MVNEEIILRKITKLREYVNELRQAKDITWENYKKTG